MSDSPEAVAEFDKMLALYDALHRFLTPQQRREWSMLVPPLDDAEEPEGERLTPRRADLKPAPDAQYTGKVDRRHDDGSPKTLSEPKTDFVDACFDVERLGRLLRSIVLLGRQVDGGAGAEDGHCIAEVAEVAQDTWERIKPHLPGALATA